MAPTRIREGVKAHQADSTEASVNAFGLSLAFLAEVRRSEAVFAAADHPEPLKDYTLGVGQLNLHRGRRLLL